jgi:hypothetical protein
MASGGARTRWLLVAAVALLLVVLGGVIGFRRAVFANPTEIIDRRREAIPYEEQVRRLAGNHTGPDPCLRYPTLRPEDVSDIDPALDELVMQQGFAAHAEQVMTLVRALAEERELSMHAQSRAEEELAMLRDGAPIVAAPRVRVSRRRDPRGARGNGRTPQHREPP